MTKKLLMRLAALFMVLTMAVSGLALADAAEGDAALPTEAPVEAEPGTSGAGEEAADSPLADIAPGGIMIAGSDAVEGGETTDDAQDPGTEAAPGDAENPGADDDGATDESDNPEAEGDAGEDRDDEAGSGDAALGFGYTAKVTEDGIQLTRVVTDCAHENTETVTGEKTLISSSYINVRQHEARYQNVSYVKCLDCGYYVSYEAGSVSVEIEDHKFSYGSCDICWHECLHPNIAPEDWEFDHSETEYYGLNIDQHQQFRYDIYYAVCGICGDTAGDTKWIPLSEPENHTYNEDGYCAVCNHYRESFDNGEYNESEECPGNPEGHVFELLFSDLVWGYSKYVPRDEKSHFCYGYQEVVFLGCAYCDYVKSRFVNHPVVDDDYVIEEHHFGDGLCSCGYTAGECAHPNLYIAEVYYSDKFITDTEVVSNHNGTHTGKLMKETVYSCPDCGKRYSEQTVVTDTSACNYQWDEDEEGRECHTCPVCGDVYYDSLELDCVHLNAEPTGYQFKVGEDNVHDLNDGTHRWDAYNLVEEKYCPDCGKTFMDYDNAVYFDEPYIEEHYFYEVSVVDGISYCEACGAKNTCEHKNTDQFTAEDGQQAYLDGYEPYGYRPKDDKEHYAVHYCYTYCTDCGVELEHWYETTVDSHIWINDAVCACGLVKPANSGECLHPNASFTEDSVSVVNDIGDDDTHDVVTVTTKHWSCPDCGKTWDETGEPTVEKQPHTYENGVCTTEGCGHVCTHAKKQTGTPVPDSYASDDATHTPATVTPWTCPSCKMTGSDAGGEGTPEKHTYVQQDDGSYKCSVCDHVCGHGNATRTPGGTANDSYDTTPTTHTHKYQQLTNVACPDCGYNGTTAEDKADAPEEHAWDNGVCSVCRYACQHDWVAGEPVTTWSGEYDAAAVTPTQHTENGVESTPQTCGICGKVGEPATKDVTRQQDHTWIDGVCGVCGYECQHESATSEDKPNVTVAEIEGDDEQHRVTTITVTTYNCPVCGLIWNKAGEPVETREAHTYENGVCTTEGCGHVCGHAAKTYGAPETGYRADDDAAHIPSTKTPWTCQSCGTQAYDYSGEGEPEAHTYELQPDGSYKCSVCGHVCAHSNATQTPGGTANDGYDTTPTTHTHTYQQLTNVACPDCGYNGTTAEDKADAPEEHSWVDGVCSVCNYICEHDWSKLDGVCGICGYVCPHEEWIPGEPVTTWSGVYDDAAVTPTQHTEKGVETTPQTCAICGKAGEPATKDVTRQQDHTWVDGTCSACNYVCAHEWVDGEPVTTWSGEYDTAAVTGTDHTEKGVESIPQTCAICGIEGEPVTNEVTRALPHVWRDGVCAICSYECVHSDYEPVAQPEVFVPTGDWKSDGANSHSRTGRTESQLKCGNCGVVLETTVTQDNVTRSERHNMVDGVCTVCGYKAPAGSKPEDTEQPAEAEPVFTPADAGLHGLSTGIRMGTALCRAASGIQAQDSGATISVWKAEELIGETNAAALDTLSAQEQVLVMLNVLGYDDEVSNALTELNITLSPGATRLIDDCRAYIGALTDDALSAYHDARAKYFPGSDVETSMTLEITSAATRLERYSFTYRDGVWLYTGLSVSE